MQVSPIAYNRCWLTVETSPFERFVWVCTMAMYRRGKGTGPTDSLSVKASVDVTKVLEQLVTRNRAVMCQSVAPMSTHAAEHVVAGTI